MSRFPIVEDTFADNAGNNIFVSYLGPDRFRKPVRSLSASIISNLLFTMKTTILAFLILLFISCENTNKKTVADSKIPVQQQSAASNNDAQTVQKLIVVKVTKDEKVITVGGDNADIKGFTSQAIQTAVDAVRNSGGGTVKILPGNYVISAPVRLYSNINLVGSGPSTLLKKIKGVQSRMAVDVGYGELQATLEDASGFNPGMGIQIHDARQKGGWDATTAVITAIKGNTIYFDNYTVRDYTAPNGGLVSNACPLVSAIEAENITISDLSVDGNRAENEAMDGCRGGAIYLHKVKNALVENVNVKNFTSDGISWQITEDVTVRNCEVSGCANAGLHPGTGSPRTTIENNYSHDNDHYGLFVCWRVRHGVVRNNRFVHNNGYGLSTGHMDTDMLFENNTISDNAQDGVLFRTETADNAPHRNTFRNNLIENNGWKEGGYGFTFDSPAENVIIEGNTISNSKGSFTKAALHYTKNGIPVQFTNNKTNNLPDGEVVKD